MGFFLPDWEGHLLIITEAVAWNGGTQIKQVGEIVSVHGQATRDFGSGTVHTWDSRVFM